MRKWAEDAIETGRESGGEEVRDFAFSSSGSRFTGGWQWRLAPHASLLGELGAAPQFRFDPDTAQRQIDYAVIGRLGYRWWIRPWFALDGSVGYQAQLRVGDATQWRELVAWDIRLGTEVNIDWGHAACRGLAVLCRR